MLAFNQFCDAVVSVVRVAALAAAAALFAIVIATVFTREVLNWVWSWSEEVPRYLMIWVAFLSAAAGVDLKDHVAFDFFYNRVPGLAGHLLHTAINLGIIAFGWIMLFYGAQFVRDFGGDTMESIPFTNVWYYTSVPISGGLIMLFALRDLLNLWFAPELRRTPHALEAEEAIEDPDAAAAHQD